MLDSPVTRTVTQEYEMDWLALRIGFVERYLTNLSDPENPTCPKCGRIKTRKDLKGDCPPCRGLFWKVCKQLSYPARTRTEWIQKYKEPTSESSEKEKTTLSVVVTEQGLEAWPGYPAGLTEEGQKLCRVQAVVNIRKRLGKLTGWKTPPSPYAASIARAIAKVMDIFPHWPKDTFVWYVDVQTTNEPSQIPEKLRLAAKKRSKEKGEKASWTTSEHDIEAILSLWMYHFQDRDQSNDKFKVAQPVSEWTSPIRTPFRRVLGPDTNNLKRDLAWWAGRGVAEALDSCKWESLWDDSEKSLSLGFGGEGKCPISIYTFTWEAIFHALLSESNLGCDLIAR
jgi:hypothetical protein